MARLGDGDDVAECRDDADARPFSLDVASGGARRHAQDEHRGAKIDGAAAIKMSLMISSLSAHRRAALKMA